MSLRGLLELRFLDRDRIAEAREERLSVLPARRVAHARLERAAILGEIGAQLRELGLFAAQLLCARRERASRLILELFRVIRERREPHV
jgi:hypothetical protein